MSRAQKSRRTGLALIAGLAAVISASAGVARAEDTQDLCKAVDTHGASGAYQVLDSTPITRVQARPFMIVPQGVALLVDAPRGTTEADLHRDLAQCRGGAVAASDAVSVHREGAHYVVKLTAHKRSTALDLARSR